MHALLDHLDFAFAAALLLALFAASAAATVLGLDPGACALAALGFAALAHGGLCAYGRLQRRDVPRL